MKRLHFFRVRLIAVSDGLDTTDETNKISVTVKSLVNELFLDNLRKTTKRGLDGQFLKKYSTGGRTYGYVSEPVYESARTDPRGVPVPVGYRLTIIPDPRAHRLMAAVGWCISGARNAECYTAPETSWIDLRLG